MSAGGAFRDCEGESTPCAHVQAVPGLLDSWKHPPISVFIFAWPLAQGSPTCEVAGHTGSGAQPDPEPGESWLCVQLDADSPQRRELGLGGSQKRMMTYFLTVGQALF